MRYITAHTPATHPYPPYVNVSRHADHDGVRITVRSGPKDDGSDGAVAFIDLNADEWRTMLADATKEEYADPARGFKPEDNFTDHSQSDGDADGR